MLYNVFDTEEQAIAAQEVDFQLYIATKSGAAYIKQTTKWAEITQRLTDDKFIYIVYPEGPTEGRVQEESQTDWFPSDDII